MKSKTVSYFIIKSIVALRGRAWIEITNVPRRYLDFWTSPSAGGRGLKFLTRPFFAVFCMVALRGRAWIEMSQVKGTFADMFSRPPREGVD